MTVWFGRAGAITKALPMKTRFVADDFRVPQRVDQPTFVLRPLTTADAEKDYEAVMSSKERLRQIFGERDAWPADDMTLHENERDLEGHQTDFAQRQGFTYTVETLAGDTCLGCVYIYPCDRGDYDAQVYYWVRDSVTAHGLEVELGAFVRHWLRAAWPFAQPVFPGRDVSWHAWEALQHRAA